MDLGSGRSSHLGRFFSCRVSFCTHTINTLTLANISFLRPFFNSYLRKLPYFKGNPNTHDNAKDTAMTIIGQSTTLAKDLVGGENDE